MPTDPKPPRKNRPGAGRPAPAEPRPRRGPLRIEQSLWDAAADLGDGNAAEGIRIAIRRTMASEAIKERILGLLRYQGGTADPDDREALVWNWAIRRAAEEMGDPGPMDGPMAGAR